jgi:hypothetical protein
MFRKLKSEGGVLFWGISCFARVRRGKMSWGVGKCSHFSVSFLSLFPPFLSWFSFLFVCVAIYVEILLSPFLVLVVVMRFVGITGMGFSFVLFCVLGTRRKSEGLVRSSSSFLKFMLVKWE